MRSEALCLSLPKQIWWGGSFIDKMSIQQDLQIILDHLCLLGNHDTGKLENLTYQISKQQTK